MATQDHLKILEALGDRHEERLLAALNSLEDELANLAISAPESKGNLSDPDWAISQRPEIESIVRNEFLAQADGMVREYDEVIDSLNAIYAAKGLEFVATQNVISNLKSVAFRGFEDIASTFANELADELYQNALAGRPKAESVKAIRQKINGVYMTSDEAEINRLVAIAEGGGKKAEEAIEALHRLYAADRTGNNMRRYASQMIHDALTQFDSAVNLAAAKEIGITKWRYSGDTVRDTRDFCRRHLDKVYTEDEIRDIWSSQSWTGKAPGDPFIVRGGYNCRHYWEVEIEDA
jgi:hypothetical protein